tara:strand:- start:1378 stop:2139 length:762 start_codon:yes stop_codon:yes gene_type:complete
MNFNFVFIIPSYNNQDWYKYNIKSIHKQSYNNWRAIYIDDNSTDNTLELVKKYNKELNISSKFTYIKNSRKLGPAGSRYQGYSKTHDKEICCLLDGDDWLYGDNVLVTLNAYYNRGYNCTYGSYINAARKNNIIPNKDFAENVHRDKSYRQYCKGPNICSHLRTMKSSLIKNIDIDKYLKIDNEWIQVCTDLAEMCYVLEQKNCLPKFINQPLYVYNYYNSIRYNTSHYFIKQPDNKHMAEYRERILEKIQND